MTEDEARDWIARMDCVSRETLDQLDIFANMVIAENQRQNLIGAATVSHIWSRHILDSAQLIASKGWPPWLGNKGSASTSSARRAYVMSEIGSIWEAGRVFPGR